MRVIGKILYGSQNFHLDGPQSDRDYKVLVAPEFIDLYRMKKASKGDLPFGYDPEHDSAMDVRQFDSLLRRGNVNTIEFLFSSDFNLFDVKYTPYIKLAQEAYEKGYIAHVWKDYFASAQGLVLNSIRRYDNSDENRRKAASRGMFIMNFISYIITNNYCINKATWDNVDLYAFPRAFRFDETQSKPFSIEEWRSMFDYLEMKANANINTVLQERDFLFKQYENELQLCMQNLIADAIKEELEAR